METIQNILFARDFTPASEQAAHLALSFAQRTGARLHVVYADELRDNRFRPAAQPAGRIDKLRARLKAALEDTVPVTFDPASFWVAHEVVQGTAAAPALLRYADEHEIDLIVIGTHGRQGVRHLLLGSVAEEVVRSARCPVLVVPPRHEDASTLQPITSILIPSDLSDTSKGALELGAALAEALGASVEVLHVIETMLAPGFSVPRAVFEPDSLLVDRQRGGMESRYREAGGNLDEAAFTVVEGHPASEVLRVARERPHGLIVMGTHGRSGVDRFFLGSVAQRVLRESPCPVLIVKTPAAAPKRKERVQAAAEDTRPEVPRVVVGTDFSPSAEDALRWARRLAERINAQLHVVHVLPSPDVPVPGGERWFTDVSAEEAAMLVQRKQAEDLMDALLDRQANGAEDVSAHFIEGNDPAASLRLFAQDEGAEMLVIGAHGRRGLGPLVGRITRAMANQAPCPVVVVRGAGEKRAPGSLLVPLDFSRGSDAALEVATRLAERAGARLTLLHALRTYPYAGFYGEYSEAVQSALASEKAQAEQALREQATALESKGLRVETVVGVGYAPEVIAKWLDESDADLVVMGTQGKSAVARFVLGSVAETVLRTAPCPVMLVPLESVPPHRLAGSFEAHYAGAL